MKQYANINSSKENKIMIVNTRTTHCDGVQPHQCVTPDNSYMYLFYKEALTMHYDDPVHWRIPMVLGGDELRSSGRNASPKLAVSVSMAQDNHCACVTILRALNMRFQFDIFRYLPWLGNWLCCSIDKLWTTVVQQFLILMLINYAYASIT